jgi:hypothetical protein
MDKEAVDDVTNSILKAIREDTVRKVFPYVGDVVVDSLKNFAALRSERKFKRVSDFLQSLAKEVNDIKDKINNDYISKNDFSDVCEETINYVANERNEDKRIYYKNVLLHSMSQKSCSYDKTEDYMRVLNQLDTLGLEILKVLIDPVKYNKEQGYPIKELSSQHVGLVFCYQLNYRFINILQKLMKQDEDTLLEELYFLKLNRLVVSDVESTNLTTNSNPILVLNNCLTKRGKDFVSFLVNS